MLLLVKKKDIIKAINKIILAFSARILVVKKTIEKPIKFIIKMILTRRKTTRKQLTLESKIMIEISEKLKSYLI